MDSTRCQERVYPNERWGSFHGHQCKFKVWKDCYCKKHHPYTVKARHEAREKAWKKQRENNPLLLLQKANVRIEELERQLASSNEIREAEKKILIQEVEKNKELKEVIRILKERIDDMM
jgi:hypothetical protein